jgi:hypothetical protein
MNMEKEKRLTSIFFIILVAAIVYAVCATYYRAFVQKDFTVMQPESTDSGSEQ